MYSIQIFNSFIHCVVLTIDKHASHHTKQLQARDNIDDAIEIRIQTPLYISTAVDRSLFIPADITYLQPLQSSICVWEPAEWSCSCASNDGSPSSCECDMERLAGETFRTSNLFLPSHTLLPNHEYNFTLNVRRYHSLDLLWDNRYYVFE